ncbi:MAG TPA: hypothetical protein VM846_13160 [Vicinamibacterales bacterium]|jgi:hypothetical protein|nr:hypothetical protein [Vicinamibacterales bacterium]
MKRLATLALALLVMSSGTALAQDTGDFSAGYRFLRTDGVNFGTGWYVDVAGHVTEVVSIVGEVAGTYKSFSETFQGITVEADAKLHTFMGGARLRVPVENMSLAPFGQILFGVGNARGSASSGGVSFSDSQTDGAMSLSGGVDVNGSGALGLRVMAGWLRDFSEDGGNAFTFSIGAKFGF